jgi:hypothetical protein
MFLDLYPGHCKVSDSLLRALIPLAASLSSRGKFGGHSMTRKRTTLEK